MTTIADKLTALAAVKEAQRVALSLGTGVPFAEYVDNFPSGGTPEWTPLDLPLSAGLVGDYRPWDLSTLFQDAAGTIPVTADGQPVGLILDKSPAGNHLSTLVLAQRPTYQTDGVKSWLFFDGIDDLLTSATVMPLMQTFTLVAVVKTLYSGGASANIFGQFLSVFTRSLALRTSSVVQLNANIRSGGANFAFLSGKGLFPVDQQFGLSYIPSIVVGSDKIAHGYLDGSLASTQDASASIATGADAPLFVGRNAVFNFYGGAVFTTALSSVDRLKVEGYYGSKRWVS